MKPPRHNLAAQVNEFGADIMLPDWIGPEDRFDGAAFVPRVGDIVEFRSDIQTEKGPSSGSVIAVDRTARTAVIRHSDHPGETFSWGKVEVNYCRPKDKKMFWSLK